MADQVREFSNVMWKIAAQFVAGPFGPRNQVNLTSCSSNGHFVQFVYFNATPPPDIHIHVPRVVLLLQLRWRCRRVMSKRINTFANNMMIKSWRSSENTIADAIILIQLLSDCLSKCVSMYVVCFVGQTIRPRRPHNLTSLSLFWT